MILFFKIIKIFDNLKPIDSITILIAFISLYIAYRQYKNERYKFKIDLFDRRHKVYLLLGEILSELIQGNNKTDPNNIKISIQMGKCERISKFLFPSNIQDEITKIIFEGDRLICLRSKLKTLSDKKSDEFIELSIEKNEVLEFLSNKFMKLEEIFCPIMNLEL